MAASKATGAGERVKTDQIVIRKCCDLQELRACVALQKEVWNFSDLDLIPLRMFVVAEKIGGQVIGDSTPMRWLALHSPFRGRGPVTPICTHTCWRSVSSIATAGSAVALNCFSARTPFLVALN